MLIIITAPSGAGKTSITHYLLSKYSYLAFSISAATRKPRPYEKDGTDYYFMSVDAFHERIQHDEFIEWEMVYEGKFYGTLKSELVRIWNNGQVPVLDIDVKGAIHVQEQFRDHCLSIFIEPPSIETLKRRLESRGTETVDSLATRISKASYEISFKDHFNQVIVNDDLGTACQTAEVLIEQFVYPKATALPPAQ